jgi:hypothetical protein
MSNKKMAQPEQFMRFLVELALMPLRILLLEGSWSIFPKDPSLNHHRAGTHGSKSDRLQPGLSSLWDFHL